MKPSAYAAAYVGLIPAFAAIYSYAPRMSLDYSKTEGSFWANLYYSVVTINTLGYGDIVSKNTETQIVTATESILGVVLIGLFLNSIAQHISNKSSMEEKEAQEIKRITSEALKLQNVNKIVELNIQYYLMYTIPVTTPISKRKDQDTVNENFTFNDMQDLYGPSLKLTDSHFQPAIYYYYHHQDNLINSIKELIYHVDLQLWPDLEALCLDLLRKCKELDFSEYIKGQPNTRFGDKKGSEFDVEMIKTHEGDVKFLQSNAINAYVALYWLIKSNIAIIKQYREQVTGIVSAHLRANKGLVPDAANNAAPHTP